MTITPLQSVESKGEILAVKLARLLVEGKREDANESLRAYAIENKMVAWEVSAVASIARAMVDGRKWKK